MFDEADKAELKAYLDEHIKRREYDPATVEFIFDGDEAEGINPYTISVEYTKLGLQISVYGRRNSVIIPIAGNVFIITQADLL
jgi:hypothetical protein